ncbi:MAG: hypothetical protein GF390_00115 [Candidatus Pacebacteria bacterium]|nr:hypothetical protein [Candidatus Paceibacterota bacterium]
MKKTLQQHHSTLTKFLKQYFQQQQARFQNQIWTKDVFSRLYPYTTTGKMVRGSMVLTIWQFLAEQNSVVAQDQVIKLAAGIELFHSGLLIHDDIIDQDQLRRGQPAMHQQYSNWTKKHSQARHFGHSMAQCVGDICLMLSFDLLAEAKLEPAIENQLLKLWAKEITSVALAEMHDVELAMLKTKTTQAEILKMYLYKTGRYTFSLPFMTGAIAAQAKQTLIDNLAKLGEYLGIIFQIKDDELGLMAKQTKLGKPIGSDIREGKKTIFYHYLIKQAQPKDKAKIQQLFGNSKLTQQDIKFVQQQLKKTESFSAVNQLVDSYTAKAKRLIAQLKISKKNKQFLEKLLQYNLQRKY